MATPLTYAAALLSIGTLAINSTPYRETAGIPISLAQQCPANEIDDRFDVVISYGRDGSLRLNNQQLEEQALRWSVADQMKRRWGKLVWIAADEGATYGNVVGIIAKLKQDTPDLRLVIATRSQTGEFDPAGHRYATTGQPDLFFASISELCVEPLPR